MMIKRSKKRKNRVSDRYVRQDRFEQDYRGGTSRAYRYEPQRVYVTPKRKRRRSAKYYAEQRRKRLVILMAVILFLGGFLYWRVSSSQIDPEDIPEYVQSQIITQDGHARTGWELERPKDIVIHYVANPGSSAQANRDFFDSAQSGVSAHFVVGLDGEIIQCIPLNEQSSASNNRNHDTISIEVCHPDETGEFNRRTYDAVVKLTAWLCEQYGLDEEDVIRHYDITGKICPKYFVDDPDAWIAFKEDVKDAL